jgi:phosphoribosyl 1,2-cyclic phosphodiesterase
VNENVFADVGEITKMSLRVCSFGSGSSGNCYLVASEQSALLIDAGLSGIATRQAIALTDVDLERIGALLVTHEHIDHVRGLDVLAKAIPSSTVYASFDTWSALTKSRIPSERRESFQDGDEFMVGDIAVETFALSHDSEGSSGYILRSGDSMLSLVTDTGILTDEVISVIADSDMIILEANHDVTMLRTGRYPPYLKARILSEVGHLSNVQAGEAILKIMALDSKPRCILLAHLSEDNNDPRLAKETVNAMLAEEGYYSGRDLYVDTLKRKAISNIFVIP